MKQRDIIELLVAVLIIAVAGFFFLQILKPHKTTGNSSSKHATYVQVTPVSPTLDQTSLNQLTNSSQVRDFYNPPNLNSGLNNAQPFGPLQ